MSQLLSDVRAGGGLITAVNGGNNITVNTVAGVATVNVSGTTNHAVQVGNALGALTSIGIGGAGQVLTSNGPGLDPSFQAPSFSTLTFDGNTGTANPIANIINIVTANSTFKTAAAGNTVTLDFFQVNSNIGSSLPAITTGTRNTGYGAGVNQDLTSGNDNTTIGYGALVNATTGSQNISVGTQALKLANGDSNTAIGYQSLSFLTSGSNNIGLGFQSGINATTNGSCIYIGHPGVAAESNVQRLGTDGNGVNQVNTTVIAGDVSSVRSFTATAGNITATAGDVVITAGNLQITAATNAGGTQGLISFLGSGAANRLISMRGTGNTFVGYQSGNTTLTTVSAIGNSGFGLQALQALTTGSGNVAVGQAAGTAITTGSNNVALGIDALEFVTTGSSNIAIGNGAGSAYTTESNNIVLGLAGVAADSAVTRIGNIYGTTVGGTNAVVVIDNTGKLGTAGGGADFIATITGNTGGAESPAAGNFNIVTANSTIKFAGSAATETLDFSNTNLALGSALPSLAGGVHNVAVGQSAMAATTTGSSNVAVGWSALTAMTTGGESVAVGNQAMSNAIFTGSGCVAVGDNALRNATSASGDVCLGQNALFDLSTGSQNTAIGSSTLGQLTTGSNNICIGNGVGYGNNYTSSESSNILVGNQGVLAENNTIRLGTSGGGAGQQNRCFIAGIDGVNVGSVAKVVTMASDQLGTATITAGSGISVTPGANTITIANTSMGLAWTVETVNLTATVNHGIIANKAGTLVITLPAVCAIGDVIRVTGINTALGWQIQCGAGQQIFVGNGSTTVAGTITSTAIRDSIEIVCVATNLTFNAISWVGNLTLA